MKPVRQRAEMQTKGLLYWLSRAGAAAAVLAAVALAFVYLRPKPAPVQAMRFDIALYLMEHNRVEDVKVSIAENRAAFSLRRRRSLGFSKCRWLRTTLRVPSRSIFFFNRRRALSTDSPFLSLISVNPSHFLSGGDRRVRVCLQESGPENRFAGWRVSTGKTVLAFVRGFNSLPMF